jgi:hypothetical protein
MNWKHSALACLILPGALAILATQSEATTPALGAGITVDGNPADWNLATDFAADMYNSGNANPNWPGYAVLSKLYLRYDCSTGTLCILVLDVAGDGRVVVPDPSDAWVKLYGVGLANDLLVNGWNEGGTLAHSFAWVHETAGDPLTPVVGYEACAHLEEGVYPALEAHLVVLGPDDDFTSSTGRNEDMLSLSIQCEPGGVVGAEELPGAVVLGAAYPNPFNPETVLTITLAETGPASLKVYDLSGREVATLLNGLVAAGTQELRFQAGNLPSGAYLAVLRAGGAVSTQKLLLVK